MKRRDALRGAAAGAALLVIPSIGAGCATSASPALRTWQGPPPDLRDDRLRVLSFAILAPNAHNTQPWRLDLRRPGELDLYVDPTRLLPETDPPYRQIHISQGTFLEHLDLAARELGMTAEMTYFPRGEYGSDVLADLPVATVRLTRADAPPRDPLFAQILARHTNRRVFAAGRRLGAEQKAALALSAPAEWAALAVVDAEPVRARLAELCGEAMAVEVSAPARNRETARWFRFSSREADETRDGFGLEQADVRGFNRWFAETFVLSRARAEAPDGAFASGAVDVARDGGRSASAFALLTTPTNTRLAQVMAGRAYSRFSLTASALGLAIQPMTQATQEYPDMARLKAELERLAGVSAGRTVQMLVRVGFAASTPHAQRRDVSSLVRAG